MKIKNKFESKKLNNSSFFILMFEIPKYRWFKYLIVPNVDHPINFLILNFSYSEFLLVDNFDPTRRLASINSAIIYSTKVIIFPMIQTDIEGNASGLN